MSPVLVPAETSMATASNALGVMIARTVPLPRPPSVPGAEIQLPQAVGLPALVRARRPAERGGEKRAGEDGRANHDDRVRRQGTRRIGLTPKHREFMPPHQDLETLAVI
jgi:hypothetical protein